MVDLPIEALAIVRTMPRTDARIFPYSTDAISAAFTRACLILGITTDRMPDEKRLHFHDLRHTHATWLIAQRVPMIAVAGRLGHANAVVTMTVYAHVDKLVDRGLLTVDELGLAAPMPAPVMKLAPRAG